MEVWRYFAGNYSIQEAVIEWLVVCARAYNCSPCPLGLSLFMICILGSLIFC